MTHTATAPRIGSRGRWSGLNIALMIGGFVVFWPLGLAMLAWIIWGEELGRRAADWKGDWKGRFDAPFRGFADRAGQFAGPGGRWSTGNAAFDAYREAELKRLDEERRKVEAMRAEFESFVREVRRAKDQEEFDRFMQEFRNRTGGTAQ